MSLRKLIAVAGVCATLAACGGGAATDANTPPPPARADVPAATEALPDAAFKAGITAENPPTKLARNQQATLRLKVKNNGTAAWPVQGKPGTGQFQVNVGGHWLSADDKEVKIEQRVAMPQSLAPGAEVEVSFPVKAPDRAGSYVVEIDMVQEMVAWFEEKGSPTLKLNITVE